MKLDSVFWLNKTALSRLGLRKKDRTGDFGSLLVAESDDGLPSTNQVGVSNSVFFLDDIDAISSKEEKLKRYISYGNNLLDKLGYLYSSMLFGQIDDDLTDILFYNEEKIKGLDVELEDVISGIELRLSVERAKLKKDADRT
jgi:hypothetical protein